MADPYLPFYVDAWRADAGLSEVSYAARGLWIEMLLIMHRAEPRGYLICAGRRIGETDVATIARQTRGANANEVKRLLAELKAADVYSVADDGTVISRRMVRDTLTSKIASEHGKRRGKGGGRRGDGTYQQTLEGTLEGRHQGTPDGTVQGRLQPNLIYTNTEAYASGADRPIRPRTEPFGFADWLWGEALARDLIGKHRLASRDREVTSDLVAAKTLLATYDLAEIEMRAARFLDALASGELSRTPATVRGLASRWDWTCVAPDRRSERADDTKLTPYQRLRADGAAV